MDENAKQGKYHGKTRHRQATARIIGAVGLPLTLYGENEKASLAA